MEQDWIKYDQPKQQFAEVLASVGGRCVFVENLGELQQRLNEIDTWASAAKRLILCTGVTGGNVVLSAVEDPHDLHDLDFVLAPGEFAVAENAAVWVTDEQVRHRVVYFLTQHLALVVRGQEIVDNMHEAYARLTFDSPRYGVFISGPSKTADIEQSLVIGAHGARSLTVFILG